MLVRHGETVDNVNRIMQGQTPGCLTLHGIEQARDVARQLAGEPIDAFVSSDLKRAVDTCAIIAMPHVVARGAGCASDDAAARAVAAIVQTPLLRERDWGSFTGRYIPDLKDAVWTDDIETTGQLLDRARRFLDFIDSRFGGMTVLAVGHGIINKAIQSVYYNLPMNEIVRMENAEMRVLDMSSYSGK